MSEQQALPPRAQALSDYQQGGSIDDCPAHYNDIERYQYQTEMHRLQVLELNRMREAM